MKTAAATPVISRIEGGLGNQLFEYAAGHALARRFGVPHKVDTSPCRAPGARPLSLREFNLPLVEAAPDELRPVAPQWGGRWKSKFIVWRQRCTPFHRRRWIREESFDFDARLFSVRPPVYLDGYWQSEKYFADCAGEIRAMFRLDRAPTDRTAALGALLAAQPTVAVHVRRGDYVQNREAALFHGVCSPTYYRQAVGWIRERRPAAPLAIFSDDPAWAEAELARELRAQVIAAEPAHTAHEDFHLMGCCTHFIIANSSFSWWPAWLARTPGRLVVAPRRWFLGHDIRPADRFPSDWQVIDA